MNNLQGLLKIIVIPVVLLGFVTLTFNIQYQTTETDANEGEFYSVAISLVSSAFAKKEESENDKARDKCITGCNEDYTGDTFFDGAQRSGCRAGCDIAYYWNEITG
ncbi:hypothetical protein [Fodinibius halophilus]|uniref:Uncharacterized protein n=1 Tax=Fodinibius halophilus TaxID=1736908 RepID=A0A6M1TBG2_9BACT|nr:hypothetical protein [Fodinibius halophilus]NGP87632.1 hypothetical protein [Fodinibius halophilus]